MECAVLINNCTKTFVVNYLKNIENLLTKVNNSASRKQLIFHLDERKKFIINKILNNKLFQFLIIDEKKGRYTGNINGSITWYKEIYNKLNSLIKDNDDIFSPINS
tara:strand:- start:332 stop:649 length:318 start_codon:yes stop_codon:yes gene_type:complete